MLQDELVSWFEERGFIAPTHGVMLVKMQGDTENWQMMLYDRSKRVHISECAKTPVEAVSRMVVRLTGASEIISERQTGMWESLRTAFAGFTSSVISNGIERDV